MLSEIGRETLKKYKNEKYENKEQNEHAQQLRMNGSYDPLFKDVVTFSSPYGNYKFIDDNDSLNEEQANRFKKYNRLISVNCMFNSNLGADENYGIINNFFFQVQSNFFVAQCLHLIE